jgi:hypothetical protein
VGSAFPKPSQCLVWAVVLQHKQSLAIFLIQVKTNHPMQGLSKPLYPIVTRKLKKKLSEEAILLSLNLCISVAREAGTVNSR